MVRDEQAPERRREQTSRKVWQEETLTRIEGHIAHFEALKKNYERYVSLPIAVQVAIEILGGFTGGAVDLLTLETAVIKESGIAGEEAYGTLIEPCLKDGSLVLTPLNRSVYLGGDEQAIAAVITPNLRRRVA